MLSAYVSRVLWPSARPITESIAININEQAFKRCVKRFVYGDLILPRSAEHGASNLRVGADNYVLNN